MAWRRTIVLCASALTVGCSDTVVPLDLESAAGNWLYAGTQENPQSAILSGSLTWYAVASSPGAFEGGATLSESLQNGQQRELHGIAAGIIYSDSIADFDIVVLGIARRHVGILRGDSIAGSWVAASGGSAGGKFTLRRAPPNA